MNNLCDYMEFTGERFVPEMHGSIELEHVHRYLQACELTNGKVVLDIACGEGYGASLLSTKADRVFGVDISEDAIFHAKKRYVKDNLEYLVGSCFEIPLPNASIDLVVSFETIEHHDQHKKMMQEIKRVLRTDGILLISSPDKYNYSEEPRSINRYHVKELYHYEFKNLINNYFNNTIYFGQRVIYGSAIFPESSIASIVTFRKENGFVENVSGLPKPLFWIALASDVDLPDINVGLFEQPVEEADFARLKDKDLAASAELLRLKDEHLAVAAEMLRLKDEHLAVAAKLIQDRDLLLSIANNKLVRLIARLARVISLLWKRRGHPKH